MVKAHATRVYGLISSVSLENCIPVENLSVISSIVEVLSENLMFAWMPSSGMCRNVALVNRKIRRKASPPALG
jgi:hypothetical protein